MEDRTRTIVNKLSALIFWSTIIIFAISYLFSNYWIPDLISNFRILFLFVFILLFSFQVYLKRSIDIIINALVIVLILVPISKFFIPTKFNSNQIENTVKICSVNLELINTDIKSLESLIESEQPDVLMMMEITPKWAELLNNSSISQSYPFKIKEVRQGYFGIALFSKIKLSNTEIIESGIHRLPNIKSEIKLINKTITLIGSHPPPPIDKRHFKLRNEQYKQINGIIKSIKTPLVLMGDFNSTSHSKSLKLLTNIIDLKDSRIGKGLQPSWSLYNKSIMPLALDHIFVSKEIHVLNRYTGPNINSDHKPIIIEIGLD